MNKDPHQPISIMKCHRGFDHCSNRLAASNWKWDFTFANLWCIFCRCKTHDLHFSDGVFEVGHPDIVKLELLRIQLQMLSTKKPVHGMLYHCLFLTNTVFCLVKHITYSAWLVLCEIWCWLSWSCQCIFEWTPWGVQPTSLQLSGTPCGRMNLREVCSGC